MPPILATPILATGDKAIYGRNRRVYWSISESDADLNVPCIPQAKIAHIHMHKNIVRDYVQVWMLDHNDAWMDISEIYSNCGQSVGQHTIRHPEFPDLILSHRDDNTPAFVKAHGSKAPSYKGKEKE